MALGSLPPWLQIQPSDYLHATQAGAQLGTQIAENAQRAWEAQQRMRIESEAQNAKLQQFTMEQAAQRLAADRLEQYRQAEIANRQQELGIQDKKLGSLDIAQQRADEINRHNMAMEEAKLNQDNIRPEAGITTLPEAPGFTFLKNPSGALTPLIRPAHSQSPLERARLQLSALNSMAPRGAEDPTSEAYQSRTNAVGGILRSLNPNHPPLDIPDAPKDKTQRKANTAYKTPKGVFMWTGSGWSAPPAPTPTTAPLLSAPPTQEVIDPQDDGE